MSKKLGDFLFVFGICLIAVGILAGIIAGIVTSDGFNLPPAITIWLLSIIVGTGFVTVSGSVHEVGKKKNDDDELLKMIIEQVKNNDIQP